MITARPAERKLKYSQFRLSQKDFFLGLQSRELNSSGRKLSFVNLQANQNSNYDRPIKYIGHHQGLKKNLSEMNDHEFPC